MWCFWFGLKLSLEDKVPLTDSSLWNTTLCCSEARGQHLLWAKHKATSQRTNQNADRSKLGLTCCDVNISQNTILNVKGRIVIIKSYCLRHVTLWCHSVTTVAQKPGWSSFWLIFSSGGSLTVRGLKLSPEGPSLIVTATAQSSSIGDEAWTWLHPPRSSRHGNKHTFCFSVR